MQISELVQRAHSNARNKGFYDDCFKIQHVIDNSEAANKCASGVDCSDFSQVSAFIEHLIFNQRLLLIHSEVSEAMECDRNNKRADLKTFNELLGVHEFSSKQLFEELLKDTLEQELADIVIRVADLAGYLKIDLQAHIERGLEYNATRTHKHGGKAY